MDIADLLRLNKYGTTLDAVGQSISAGETFAHGLAFADASSFQAAQLRQSADSALASATRQAEDVDRQERLIQSRALAVAAASGGGASDPSVVSIIAQNAQEAAYRRQVVMYEGQDRARALNLAAATQDYQGKSAKVSSALSAAGQLFGATTTLMKGDAKNASLRARFGMDAPNTL